MADSRLFAVFDLETNGFRGASVVSASSIVFTGDGGIVDFFNRFYYPEETPDRRTEAVHGLHLHRIGRFRKEEPYAPHFTSDWRSLAEFWDRYRLDGIVVHNLSFDISFLPREATRGRKWWCSMRGLADFCRIPGASGREAWKWPRLGEAKSIVEGRIPPPEPLSAAERDVGPPLSHYGLSDCFELLSLFVRIWTAFPQLPRFRSSHPFYLPPRGQKYPLPASCLDPFVEERTRYAIRIAECAGLAEKARLLRSLLEQ